MENYEKNISLKTIWLTIIRRFLVIIFIFIPIALISLIVTQFVMTKTYQSTTVVTKDAVFSAQHYELLKVNVQSEDVAVKAADNLKNNGVKHANGNEITSGEIYSGLSFASLGTNSLSVTYYFQSTDSSITKPVLAEVANVSNEALVARTEFATLRVTTPANDGQKNSSENKYLLIGVAAGFVVACGVAFVYEIIADEVYDKKDVEMLGCEAFEIK